MEEMHRAREGRRGEEVLPQGTTLPPPQCVHHPGSSPCLLCRGFYDGFLIQAQLIKSLVVQSVFPPWLLRVFQVSYPEALQGAPSHQSSCQDAENTQDSRESNSFKKLCWEPGKDQIQIYHNIFPASIVFISLNFISLQLVMSLFFLVVFIV